MAVLKGSFTEKVLWDFYAAAYDNLARYYAPYGRVMDEAQTAVAKDNYMHILDAGCGTGELAIRLLRMGKKMACIDVSSAMLAIFRKKLKKIPGGEQGCFVRSGDLNENLPYETGSFDAVCSIHALFMLDDKFKALNEFDRVLKPGGRIVIAHVRPVSISALLAAELSENGTAAAVKVFFRLFSVGLINILLSGRHKKVYGIVPADVIIEHMKALGYITALQKKMYRGFDDFMVFDKKAENGQPGR